MSIRKTYRIEYHNANSGWILRRPDFIGLSARKANRIVTEEREFERYYSVLGCRPARLRVVCEQTGRGCWSVGE